MHRFVRSKYRHMAWLNQFMHEPAIFLNPDNAEARGLREGDSMRRFGEVHVKMGPRTYFRAA